MTARYGSGTASSSDRERTARLLQPHRDGAPRPRARLLYLEQADELPRRRRPLVPRVRHYLADEPRLEAQDCAADARPDDLVGHECRPEPGRREPRAALR